jgi:hypothetical protein
VARQRMETEGARIATDLLRKARFICACSQGKLRLTDLLDSILRPALTHQHEEALEQIRHPAVSSENTDD